ncbi:reverse transcriptase domain-containing protein [Tanacetum coccineum]|uniref:Reverse transcriptase domain-containing protein n=1 Tax=Tanacetum coccineum TaxID=301880 RepID=A0ABQ5D8N4_9ASTR
MDKIHHNKRKEFHSRLDFGESPKKRRIREGSQNSSARTLSARRDSSNRDRPRSRHCSRGVKESYDNTRSSYGTGTKHGYHSRNRDRSRYVKRRRKENHRYPPGRVSGDAENLGTVMEDTGSQSKKGTSIRMRMTWRCPGYVKRPITELGDPEDHVKIFQAAAQVERWAMPTWCHMFNSTLIGAARVWFDELPPESIDGYKDLKAAFLAYFMQQKKYVKDPVKIHNIKQRDGETIEEFMERFKVETRYIKGAPECMRISGFMHGEKPSCWPKERAASWRAQGTVKAARFLEQRSVFEVSKGRTSGLVDLPPYMESSAAEAGSSNRHTYGNHGWEKEAAKSLCDFHNDKGHITDECMQLNKKIE